MLEFIWIGTHVCFHHVHPQMAFTERCILSLSETHWLHLWDLSPIAAAATASQLYRTEDVTASVRCYITLVHCTLVQLFSCTVHGRCHSRRTTVEVLIVYHCIPLYTILHYCILLFTIVRYCILLYILSYGGCDSCSSSRTIGRSRAAHSPHTTSSSQLSPCPSNLLTFGGESSGHSNWLTIK